MLKQAIKKTNEIIIVISIAVFISCVWCALAVMPVVYAVLIYELKDTFLFWLMIIAIYPLLILYVMFWMYSIKFIKEFMKED